MGLNPVFEVSFEVKIQSEKAAAWGPPTGSLLFGETWNRIISYNGEDGEK